jgi:predicted dehydrogenase
VGMQTRSSAYTRNAAEYIQSGNLGKVYLVRVYNMMKHSAMKEVYGTFPQGFDADLWAGPAAKPKGFLSHSWLNLFEYSCGPIPGDAIHQMDLARMLMGNPGHPKSVTHTGGIYSLKDGRDTPDTQLATFEFPEFTMTLEGALWTPYIMKTPMEMRDKDQIPNWPFNSTRVEVYGDKGFMYYGRHGDGWQVFDSNAKLSRSEFGRQADKEHIENFIQCIHDRKHPAADVEHGHLSTSLCHLANASFRTGNQKLVFDPDKEVVTNLAEANQYLKRASCRAPWIVPEVV